MIYVNCRKYMYLCFIVEVGKQLQQTTGRQQNENVINDQAYDDIRSLHFLW